MKHESCLAACIACAQACEQCATACLHEDDVKMMARCIQLDRDCSMLCWGMAALLNRDSQFAASYARVCAEACEACAEECAKHKEDHCQRCAEACRKCAKECRAMG